MGQAWYWDIWLQSVYDYGLMIIYFVVQCCVSLAAFQVADICVSGAEWLLRRLLFWSVTERWWCVVTIIWAWCMWKYAPTPGGRLAELLMHVPTRCTAETGGFLQVARLCCAACVALLPHEVKDILCIAVVPNLGGSVPRVLYIEQNYYKYINMSFAYKPPIHCCCCLVMNHHTPKYYEPCYHTDSKALYVSSLYESLLIAPGREKFVQ